MQYRVRMKGKKELLFLCVYSSTACFKHKRASDVQPLITRTTQISDATSQPSQLRIFPVRESGHAVMDNLRDQLYSTGQETQSAPIGDFGTGKWGAIIAGYILSPCAGRV